LLLQVPGPEINGPSPPRPPTTLEAADRESPTHRSLDQSAAASPDRRFRAGMRVLGALSAAALFWLLWRGASFYLTADADRPLHPDYERWRPAGDIGHGLGILGSLMMVVLLGYSLRKRWRRLRSAGPISRWLSVHIYLGVVGPLLVVLHSAFKVHGLVSLSFWSMVAVAGSGVFGRYLYLQIPRNLQGDELDRQALDAEETALGATLVADFGLDPSTLAGLSRLGGAPAAGSLGAALAASLISDLTLSLRLRRFLARRTGGFRLPAGERRRLVALARRRALLARRRLLLERLARIFHYWHVIHKPFAIVMLVIMIVHVGVTALLGYKWIF